MATSSQWYLFCAKYQLGKMAEPFHWWLNFNERQVESMQIQDFEQEWEEFLHELRIRYKAGRVAAIAAGE